MSYNLLGHPECPIIEKDGMNHISMTGIVSLKYAFRKQLFVVDCHGILISKKHILTQAGCVESNNFRKLQFVSLGSSLNSYGDLKTQYGISKTTVSGQLAILTLADEIHQSVKPACLPTRPESGDLNVLFWQHSIQHPKYLQRTNVTGKIEEGVRRKRSLEPSWIKGTRPRLYKIEDTIKVEINEGNRIGGAALWYSIREDNEVHSYVRALEKCPVKGCSNTKTSEFIDIMKYREWIKNEVLGDTEAADQTPPILV